MNAAIESIASCFIREYHVEIAKAISFNGTDTEFESSLGLVSIKPRKYSTSDWEIKIGDDPEPIWMRQMLFPSLTDHEAIELVKNSISLYQGVVDWVKRNSEIKPERQMVIDQDKLVEMINLLVALAPGRLPGFVKDLRDTIVKDRQAQIEMLIQTPNQDSLEVIRKIYKLEKSIELLTR